VKARSARSEASPVKLISSGVHAVSWREERRTPIAKDPWHSTASRAVRPENLIRVLGEIGWSAGVRGFPNSSRSLHDCQYELTLTSMRTPSEVMMSLFAQFILRTLGSPINCMTNHSAEMPLRSSSHKSENAHSQRCKREQFGGVVPAETRVSVDLYVGLSNAFSRVRYRSRYDNSRQTRTRGRLFAFRLLLELVTESP
jgi:hypothetical protein